MTYILNAKFIIENILDTYLNYYILQFKTMELNFLQSGFT